MKQRCHNCKWWWNSDVPGGTCHHEFHKTLTIEQAREGRWCAFWDDKDKPVDEQEEKEDEWN